MLPEFLVQRMWERNMMRTAWSSWHPITGSVSFCPITPTGARPGGPSKLGRDSVFAQPEKKPGDLTDFAAPGGCVLLQDLWVSVRTSVCIPKTVPWRRSESAQGGPSLGFWWKRSPGRKDYTHTSQEGTPSSLLVTPVPARLNCGGKQHSVIKDPKWFCTLYFLLGMKGPGRRAEMIASLSASAPLWVFAKIKTSLLSTGLSYKLASLRDLMKVP